VFSPIEPFASGHLAVGPSQTLYWETSGNPHGKPAVYLHGGPGGGIQSRYRQHWDPDAFLIIGFEQRGCGRSLPLAIAPGADLAAHTTPTLIADMERLREHLGVAAWLVFGVSWGTTLALAYAQAHPERVSELVLAAVTTTTAAEVAWLTEEMRRVFPEAWERFDAASGRRPGQRLIDAYFERITSADADIREAAARAWCEWEDVHMSLPPSHQPYPAFEDPTFRLNFATLVIHYWKHGAFIAGDGLLAGMARIAHIPGVLIHGRWDVSSPMQTAWELHKAWPGSEFVPVEREGHGGPSMVDAVNRAIARFTPPA
jgi:proline iminopeptidase